MCLQTYLFRSIQYPVMLIGHIQRHFSGVCEIVKVCSPNKSVITAIIGMVVCG